MAKHRLDGTPTYVAGNIASVEGKESAFSVFSARSYFAMAFSHRPKPTLPNLHSDTALGVSWDTIHKLTISLGKHTYLVCVTIASEAP